VATETPARRATSRRVKEFEEALRID